MRHLRRTAHVILLGVAFMLAAGAPVFADHIRVVSDITVTPAERVEQGYSLSLRLRTTDGRPVNEASVRLYEVVELFGRREMYITTVVTDGQGSATTTYLPARSGRHELIARAPGREHYPDVGATFTFDATVAAPSYREPVVPLASFSAAVPYGVGVVVLAVWALIAFALFGSAIGIRRNKRSRHPIA